MLSILIPTYNYTVVSLVKSLYEQLKKQDNPFEIICFDNGSNLEICSINEEINKIEFCTYKLLKTNGGRSKTRNLLAEKAKYNWLLFLDADVLPVTDNFIHIYFESVLKNDLKVAFGGLKYEGKPTGDRMLRWVYGKSREEIPLSIRKKNPQEHFTSANFLINKDVFQQFKFDESLVKYGYEDTLLAIELNKNNIQITQIDNPVYHLGIDKNEVFLNKTRESVKNLVILNKQQKVDIQDFKILKAFENIKKYKMVNILKTGFEKYANSMEKNLKSAKPSLFIYDMYKLGYLCSIQSEK